MVRGNDDYESHYSPQSQLSSPDNEDSPDGPPSRLPGGKQYTMTITKLDLSVYDFYVYYSARPLPLTCEVISLKS